MHTAGLRAGRRGLFPCSRRVRLDSFLHRLKHQGKVLGPVELFSYKKGGGVDIAIVRVKIGLNFGTCKADFVRDG
jgi:hypothetical protein